jgi:hypothetical protein
MKSSPTVTANRRIGERFPDSDDVPAHATVQELALRVRRSAHEPVSRQREADLAMLESDKSC